VAKQTGTSTGGIETSARYRKKQARRRREEERAWAEQNGPIILRLGETVYYIKKDVVKSDLKRVREAILGRTPDLDRYIAEGVVRLGS
jgi:hypothetical protein